MRNTVSNIIICMIKSASALIMAYMIYSYAGQQLKLSYTALGYSPIEAACAVDSRELASRKMCIEAYKNLSERR